MNDSEIGNAMRRLPRVTASPRFTSDVLRRSAGSQPAPSRLRVGSTFAAVTAMVLMIIAGTYAAALRQRQERLASLRAERQRIEMELQRVKTLANQSQPVVVIESGDTRLIVNRQDPKQSPLFYY
jgi:hypothetical protein